MKLSNVVLLILSLISFKYVNAQDITPNNKYVLVIHGGAGGIQRGQLTEERELAYKKGLEKALFTGKEILQNGGNAIDAIQAVIMVLEDDTLFNAGRGAVFNYKGENELDASIMDGSNLNAGAVAGVTIVKNPIAAARQVMDNSEHVMLAGKGAEQFAAKQKLELVKPSYFSTEHSRRVLNRLKKEEGDKSQRVLPGTDDSKYGTVGAVALDMHGNLAAGTSTGGMSNKRYNRIGDSPIIGAGTYADNNSCAVSCTGWGEYFIRLVMAKTICDYVEMKGMPIKDAVNMMLHDKLENMGASGGAIAIDKDGNFTIDFNTYGMNRAWITSEGAMGVEIYGLD